MRFSIADTILARCIAHPARIACEMVGRQQRYDFGWIGRRLQALAEALRPAAAGRHGVMVGMLLPNGIDAALAYAACQLAGVAGVTLNARLSERELTAIMRDADCRLLLSAEELLPRAQDLCLQNDCELLDLASLPTPEYCQRPLLGEKEIGDRACVVAYSSGTTGEAKGAIYSNDYFSMNNYRWGWQFGLSADQVVLIAGPMFHLSYGGFALAGLSIGARIRILPQFSAEAAFEELDQRASFAFLVPSMIRMLLDESQRRGGAQMHAARHVISAGAPLPLALAREAMQVFPGAKIAEMYGSTEAGFVSYEVKATDSLLAHSVGWPALGADVCLFRDDGGEAAPGEAGEIGVKSPVRFSGYLGRPELTEAAFHKGFLMTGDVGLIQPDGRLCVVDRKKDMIISGGENVYCAEVERVLLEHSGIEDAAVLGLPDPLWGERVTAVVVPRAGARIDLQDLREHCALSLADYKLPREAHCLAQLPRNAMGKIQKFRLRELLLSGV